MTTTRLTTLAALLVLALLLAGCGGGGGEPTVTQTVHDELRAELQAELDAALANLAAEREAKTEERQGRTAAETQVGTLTTQLEASTADVTRLTGELETATGDVTRLTGELVTATAEVARLETELETATDNAEDLADRLKMAEASVTQLRMQLQSAAANVQTLTAQIGTIDDAQSLNGMLAAQKAEVRRLTAEIGDEDDKANAAAAASLHAQLNAAKEVATDAEAEVDRLEGVIGTAADSANAAATATLHAQLKYAKGEATTAKAEVARLTREIGSVSDRASAAATATLYARLNHANGRVRELTGQLSTANAKVAELTNQIGTTGDATSLRGQLEAANTKANRLEAELEAANTSLNSLRGQLTTAQQQRQQAETARQQAETARQQAETARQQAEDKVEEAQAQGNITLRAAQWIAEAGLDLAAGDEREATVEYVGSRLTFEPDGGYTPGSGAPTVLGGWRKGSFSDTSGAGTETAYLYTDIQRTSAKEFWKLHGATVSGITGANNPKARRTGGLVHDTEDSETTFRGTFDSAAGIFSCAGGDVATCNAANAKNANEGTGLVVVTGTTAWTFTPDKNQLTKRITQKSDLEYLWFGIWAYEPNSPSTAHEFQWIADGVGTIPDASFAALTGTAKFNGGAVGRYALKAQAGRAAKVGTFTATATFNADFEDGEVEGRITDFKEGSASLSGWSLYLGSTNRDPVGSITTPSASHADIFGSIGGVAVDTGGWAATFHGSENPGVSEFGDGLADCPATAGCPAADLAGVVGWFDAFDGMDLATSNAAVAGAFGAACTTSTLNLCAR